MNANTMTTPATDKQHKAVYTIVESPKGKSFWVKIGVAYVNRDGSLNLKLDALPVNGSLHVRDPQPRDNWSDLAGSGPKTEPRGLEALA